MAQLTAQEMIARMKIQHDGATVRLEVDIDTRVSFDDVAMDVHRWLTSPGDKLTLIGGSGDDNKVHLMCIINTNEKAEELGERLTRYLTSRYQCAVVTEWFQLEEKDAIELWSETMDTAETAWSINSRGGES